MQLPRTPPVPPRPEGVLIAGEGATHYAWSPHTRRLASWLLYLWPCSVNTYYDHPTGWGEDHASIDVWGQEGRGSHLGSSSSEIVEWLLSDASEPWQVRWLLSDGYLWTPGGGWQPYWDASDMHFDHVHVTIWP